MAASHRAACERLVSLAPESAAYGPTLRTIVGIDENALHPELAPTLRGLLRDIPDVFMILPLWHEIRETVEGETFVSGGGSPTGIHDGVDWGRRRPGDSYSDEKVVKHALSYLYVYRRVIVLSQNRRKDPSGLRSILFRDVGPVLNADRSHGLAMILLLKQPNTSMRLYGEKVAAYMRSAAFEPGYFEGRL